MLLKPGVRLRSTVCTTQVVIVRAPDGEVELSCGGAAMVPVDAAESGDDQGGPTVAGPTELGKRYEGLDGALEALCTKGGTGGLSIDDVALTLKSVRPLPSSD